jgi:hypothetical protein
VGFVWISACMNMTCVLLEMTEAASDMDILQLTMLALPQYSPLVDDRSLPLLL